MDLVDELQRLKTLFYVTFGLLVVVLIVTFALIGWFAWELRSGNELLRRYPLRARLQAVLARPGRWEYAVRPEHIPLLQKHRSTAKKLFVVYLVGMLLSAGLSMLIQANVERVVQVGESARSQTYENVCP